MMPTVVDIQKADDPRDVIHRAVQLLADGELVAFPTETVYVVCAYSLSSEAVGRLRRTFNSHGGPPHALAIKGADEALDYVPRMTRLGRKLARRCWPGPVTIEFDVSRDEGLVKSLPAETCDAVVPGGAIRLRVPAHQVLTNVLKLLPAPVVMSAETLADAPAATTAEQVAERFAGALSLIIDDGSCRYAEPATVVHVSNDEWRLVEPGVVTETTLSRLASEAYLLSVQEIRAEAPWPKVCFANSWPKSYNVVRMIWSIVDSWWRRRVWLPPSEPRRVPNRFSFCTSTELIFEVTKANHCRTACWIRPITSTP